MRRILYAAIPVVCLTFALSIHAAQEVRDPIKEAARKLDHQITAQNYKDLKDAANELAKVSKDLSDEVDASSEHVINARIFDQLDKIDKLTKTIRTKAKGPLKPDAPLVPLDSERH